MSEDLGGGWKYHGYKTGRFSSKTPNRSSIPRSELPNAITKFSEALVTHCHGNLGAPTGPPIIPKVKKRWYQKLFSFIKIIFCRHTGTWVERNASYTRDCLKCGWVSFKPMSLIEFQKKRGKTNA